MPATGVNETVIPTPPILDDTSSHVLEYRSN